MKAALLFRSLHGYSLGFFVFEECDGFTKKWYSRARSDDLVRTPVLSSLYHFNLNNQFNRANRPFSSSLTKVCPGVLPCLTAGPCFFLCLGDSDCARSTGEILFWLVGLLSSLYMTVTSDSRDAGTANLLCSVTTQVNVKFHLTLTGWLNRLKHVGINLIRGNSKCTNQLCSFSSMT